MVAALRGSRTVPSNIRIDFERPVAEPMLWIPDAVAGAVGNGDRSSSHLTRGCHFQNSSARRPACFRGRAGEH